MSLRPEFYAAKVAEYGADVKTMADAFEAAIKRRDEDEARRYLQRIEHHAWLATDNAKSALERYSSGSQR